jgi:AraC family transcriptional regulator
MHSATARAGSSNDRDMPSVKSVPRFGKIRRRSTLHSSHLIQVEDCYIPPEGPFPDAFEHRIQIALIYHGIFSYRVGKQNWTVDANQSLFISPGWEASEEHPLPGLGHAGVLLNPSLELLDEIAPFCGHAKSVAFASGTLPASMRLKLLTQHILQQRYLSDPLWLDEWAVESIRESMRSPPHAKSRSSKVIGRAKEVLHACSSERLSLKAIAEAVGVTPVYLTQEFTRVEGIPLYRYQLRLRLTLALVELPHCNDITGLALDLGFSSHSHFTATFKSAFGITPNLYRESVGTHRLDILEKTVPRFNQLKPRGLLSIH